MTHCFAQDSTTTIKPQVWSIRASCGYAMPFAQQYIGENDHYNSQNNLSRTLIKGSYGQGIFNSLMLDYSLTSHIAISFGGFANWGKEIHVRHYSSELYTQNFDDDYSQVNSIGTATGVLFSERFRKCTFGLGNYFLCGLYNKGTQRSHFGDDNETSTWIIENTKGISIGSKTDLSYNYHISDHLSIGIEAFVILRSWRPKHGEIKKAEYNGVDAVPNMLEEHKSFDYPETFQSPPSNPYLLIYSFSYPLHSAGMNLRCTFSF